MGFFVGGQLMLAAVVVPVLRGGDNSEGIRRVARRFGVGSGVAILVLIVTGSLMASQFHRWGNEDLHIKLEGLVFLASLAIVWLGIAIAH